MLVLPTLSGCLIPPCHLCLELHLWFGTKQSAFVRTKCWLILVIIGFILIMALKEHLRSGDRPIIMVFVLAKLLDTPHFWQVACSLCGLVALGWHGGIGLGHLQPGSTTKSGSYRIRDCFLSDFISMYTVNSNGDRTHPCITPDFTKKHFGEAFWVRSELCLFIYLFIYLFALYVCGVCVFCFVFTKMWPCTTNHSWNLPLVNLMFLKVVSIHTTCKSVK